MSPPLSGIGSPLPRARDLLTRQLRAWLMMLLALPGLCGGTAAASPSLPAPLRKARLIAYTPRTFSMAGNSPVAATAEGIRADLLLLRPLFDGLLTYSATSGLETVPAIARELGYQAVVLGIWDPRSAVELKNVLGLARRYPALVAAVVVGNEGIYTNRYQTTDVLGTARRIKEELPGLAVTTSEPFFLYFKEEYKAFFQGFDLLLPNIHPVFEPWFRPGETQTGVTMVLNVAAQLRSAYSLPLLVKETGVPSGPADGGLGFTPEGQALFWSDLAARFPQGDEQALVYFEAFDAPWKPAAIGTEFPGDHAKEAFWGFFTTRGEAKPVIRTLAPLSGAER